MARTFDVTFTRVGVAHATIEVPEGFDPMTDSYEGVARDWLHRHKDDLIFDHDDTDFEIWNVSVQESAGAPPVPATVKLQRWNMHGYAEEVREIGFDCRAALDAIPLRRLPAFADDFHGKGACGCGDDIYLAAVRLRAVRGWDGPFECYIADDDAYAAYYDERAARAGLPPVER